MIPPLFGKQEVGIWQVKKRFPRYGVPIWSLWPNIRFLPLAVCYEKKSDGHQFHQYQQSKQSPLILTELTNHKKDNCIWCWKSRSWLVTDTKCGRVITFLHVASNSLYTTDYTFLASNSLYTTDSTFLHVASNSLYTTDSTFLQCS
jgi:hypothetical protein